MLISISKCSWWDFWYLLNGWTQPLQFTRTACWVNSKSSNRDNSCTHYNPMLSLLLVVIMLQILKDSHILKLLKVNCSNTACSARYCTIFLESRMVLWGLGIKKHLLKTRLEQENKYSCVILSSKTYLFKLNVIECKTKN